MLNNDVLNQYSWVMKVLDSCQNDSQLQTANKLFELFLKRWGLKSNDKYLLTLSSNFEKEKKSKQHTFRKKTKVSCFGTSQIYLF